MMTGEEDNHHKTFRTRVRPLNDESMAALMERCSTCSLMVMDRHSNEQGLPRSTITDDDEEEEDSASRSFQRLVVVRYFLDRPGYGLHNSVARLWFHPPSICTPTHVQLFLKQQGIALPGLLVEVYLDKFKSFMVLEGCEASGIEWDFENTSYANPGILNIRLTDVEYYAAQAFFDRPAAPVVDHSNSRAHTARMSPSSSTNTLDMLGQGQSNDDRILVGPSQQPSAAAAAAASTRCNEHANTTSLGLFSFSIMVGLETCSLMSSLFPDSIEPSFRLTWGPYMFFVGGLLQVIVGTLQVFRNNLYGATAFLAFGTFWFANGTKVILETYVMTSDTEAATLSTLPDPVGDLIRTLFILAFSCVLLKQTFVMSKLSTTLITLLCLKLLAQAGRVFWTDDDGWSYMQLILGWMTSVFAFYVFLVELTNNIYQRTVFPTYKWSEKHSPEEAFGAAGRLGTLQSRAAVLRQANLASFARRIRTTLPKDSVKQE